MNLSQALDHILLTMFIGFAGLQFAFGGFDAFATGNIAMGVFSLIGACGTAVFGYRMNSALAYAMEHGFDKEKSTNEPNTGN